MEQKKLVSELLNAANEIHKNRKSNASYIHLSREYIEQLADEENISFDDIVKSINNKLNK